MKLPITDLYRLGLRYVKPGMELAYTQHFVSRFPASPELAEVMLETLFPPHQTAQEARRAHV